MNQREEMTIGNAAPVLVFAHVPPPDHGQSRMVSAMLEALIGNRDVIHVDARFSNGMGDVGSRRPGKGLCLFRYLWQGLLGRWIDGAEVLYYVPGPVKWSAVVRDWVVLGILRPWFPRVVFHWHAIGQGEWSAGSDRVRLAGPDWMDSLARRISAVVLEAPDLSISVSPTSTLDSRVLGAWHSQVVCNGLEDPCENYWSEVSPLRDRVSKSGGLSRPLRVMFFSRGTLEKGVMDALKAIGLVQQELGEDAIEATFVGGVDSDLQARFRREIEEKKLKVTEIGFVQGAEKNACFLGHDAMISASHWESFGLTVAEAMAWGLPVVAAASDGVTGVLPQDYRYMAPVGNPDQLAEKVMELIRDFDEGGVEGLGNRLRCSYESEFGLEEFEERIREVLLHV